MHTSNNTYAGYIETLHSYIQNPCVHIFHIIVLKGAITFIYITIVYIYVCAYYIYIYMCVCICVGVRACVYVFFLFALIVSYILYMVPIKLFVQNIVNNITM